MTVGHAGRDGVGADRESGIVKGSTAANGPVKAGRPGQARSEITVLAIAGRAAEANRVGLNIAGSIRRRGDVRERRREGSARLHRFI